MPDETLVNHSAKSRSLRHRIDGAVWPLAQIALGMLPVIAARSIATLLQRTVADNAQNNSAYATRSIEQPCSAELGTGRKSSTTIATIAQSILVFNRSRYGGRHDTSRWQFGKGTKPVHKDLAAQLAIPSSLNGIAHTLIFGFHQFL